MACQHACRRFSGQSDSDRNEAVSTLEFCGPQARQSLTASAARKAAEDRGNVSKNDKTLAVLSKLPDTGCGE